MNDKEEKAAKYYAHNNFDMHQTNNYIALKEGFEAGVKWQKEQSESKSILKDYPEVKYFEMFGKPNQTY